MRMLLGRRKGFRQAVLLREPAWEMGRMLPDRPVLPQRCHFRVCIQGMPLLPSPCRQLPSHCQNPAVMPSTMLLGGADLWVTSGNPPWAKTTQKKLQNPSQFQNIIFMAHSHATCDRAQRNG